MKFDPRLNRRRSALDTVWRLSAVLVMMLCITPPAAAEDFLLETPDGLLAFQTPQDRTDYITWVKNGGRTAWLYFSDQMIKPCQQGQNARCHDNMVALRNAYPAPLKNARLVLRGVKENFLLALRNGNFIYPIAPSFQLLQGIVSTPGTCASWAVVANQSLKVSSGGLKKLADDADAEIPGGKTYAERAVLDGRNGLPGLLEVARSCKDL